MESVLGSPLLRPDDVEDQYCEVDRIVDRGLIACEAKSRIRYSSDILVEGAGLADLVLRTRHGRFLCLLLHPEAAMNLSLRSRFVRIDARRRRQLLHEGFAPDEPVEVPPERRAARRALVERTTGLPLVGTDELRGMLGVEWTKARYLRTAHPGSLVAAVDEPWSVRAFGRELGDVVVRLPDGRNGALLVDPEEAEAMRRHRYDGGVVRLDCSRSADVL